MKTEILKDLISKYKGKVHTQVPNEWSVSKLQHFNNRSWKNGADYNLKTVRAIAKAAGLNSPTIYRNGEDLYINYQIIDKGGYEDAREIEYIYNICINLKQYE